MEETTTGTADRAPDIGKGYPSRGERLGPAWQAVWDRLADGEWRNREDLAKEIATERGDIVPITVANLMRQACEIDLLDHRIVTLPRESSGKGRGHHGARRRAQVRRQPTAAVTTR